jgi:hypothetical protein
MASAPTPLPPGSMTVPPTFGWEQIATVLVLLVVVAVAFMLIGAALASLTGRSEWQEYLGTRSSRGKSATEPLDHPGT